MTVIASYGGNTSNSYINLTQATSFIKTAILANTDWLDLTSRQKEATLLQATRDIDSRQYIGHRFNFEQLLEFPRQLRSAFPFNRTSTATISQDTIQRRMQMNVQEATAWQAVKIAREGGRNQHIENVKNNIVGISESVGPIREFIQYGQRSTVGNMRISTESLALLQDWMTGKKMFRA